VRNDWPFTCTSNTLSRRLQQIFTFSKKKTATTFPHPAQASVPIVIHERLIPSHPSPHSYNCSSAQFHHNFYDTDIRQPKDRNSIFFASTRLTTGPSFSFEDVLPTAARMLVSTIWRSTVSKIDTTSRKAAGRL
jgi:hypothetical protein